MDIVTALHANEGICCAVGAGGKKTTLYALAERIERAVVTSTVRIPPFEQWVSEFVVTEEPKPVIERATNWPLGLVRTREGSDRYEGFEPGIIDSLAESQADSILVKADGARMRKMKAPGSHEPAIPRTANTVIPVVSAHVVGQPLDDAIVHRVDRVTEITGLEPGHTITPDAIGDVIASDQGGMKQVPPGATTVPLINMVDDDSLREAGEDIAAAIHRRVDVHRVVLARMREPDPLVAVI